VLIITTNVRASIVLSRAHRASQSSFLWGSFTVRISSPVVPVLGLSSGDWMPWSSKRTMGGYVGETVGGKKLTSHKEGLAFCL